MIGIYLCDDEDAVRRQIQTSLEQKILAENYDMKIMCSAAGAQELLDTVKDGSRGIYFLDVNLKDREWDGFRHSNLNLLVNWYFEDPINQMGQTVYTGVGYTVDRWRSESDLRVTLEDGWLKVANETDGVGWFVQFAEASLLKALAGKTVTRSALCKVEGVSASMYYGYTDNSVWISPIDIRIPTDGNAHITQLTHLTPDATNPTTFQSACFCLAAHSTLWIKAAKLELGCQQTLAHQDAEGNWVLNDPPPDRTLELAKCQRYFRSFNAWTKFEADYIDANRVSFSIPGDMRIDPTVTGDWGVYTGFTLQDGFVLEGHRTGSNLVVVASKESHGLTTAWLGVKDDSFGLLNADL